MKYRVDTFGTKHTQSTFETEEAAREYAAARKEAGKIVFLLRELYEGADIYDVLEEV